MSDTMTTQPRGALEAALDAAKSVLQSRDAYTAANDALCSADTEEAKKAAWEAIDNASHKLDLELETFLDHLPALLSAGAEGDGVEVLAPGSRAWMAEVCDTAARNIEATGKSHCVSHLRRIGAWIRSSRPAPSAGAGQTPASAVGEFVPVGYRFRVLPEYLRSREWKVGAMPVEYKQPTPPDNDTIEFQTIYVLADQGGSDK